jgi:hypothetical protein
MRSRNHDTHRELIQNGYTKSQTSEAANAKIPQSQISQSGEARTPTDRLIVVHSLLIREWRGPSYSRSSSYSQHMESSAFFYADYICDRQVSRSQSRGLRRFSKSFMLFVMAAALVGLFIMARSKLKQRLLPAKATNVRFGSWDEPVRHFRKKRPLDREN